MFVICYSTLDPNPIDEEAGLLFHTLPYRWRGRLVILHSNLSMKRRVCYSTLTYRWRGGFDILHSNLSMKRWVCYSTLYLIDKEAGLLFYTLNYRWKGGFVILHWPYWWRGRFINSTLYHSEEWKKGRFQNKRWRQWSLFLLAAELFIDLHAFTVTTHLLGRGIVIETSPQFLDIWWCNIEYQQAIPVHSSDNLAHSDAGMLISQTSTISHQVFAISYTSVWNSLPVDFRDTGLSLMTFRCRLKNYLFNSSGYLSTQLPTY